MEFEKFREEKPEELSKEEAFKQLDTDNMKYLRFNHQIILDCFFEIFLRLDLINNFNLNPEKLANFLKEVQSIYKPVPYHNFTHAFNIVH